MAQLGDEQALNIFVMYADVLLEPDSHPRIILADPIDHKNTEIANQ